MLLATLLLSAALAPQAPPAEESTPFDTPQAPTQEQVAAPVPADVAPPQAPPAAEPPPVMEAMPAPEPAAAPAAAAAPSGSAQEHIDAGLKAFIRGRFSSAQQEFQKAYELAPQSAAAAFYLAYAHYKLGEPTRRMDSNKERAKELFATAYNLDPAFQPVWGARKSE